MLSEQRASRPAALVTGVGRMTNIAAGIARRLADDGWDLALSYWRPYDKDLPWDSSDDEPDRLGGELRERGATVVLLPGDLAEPSEPDRLVSDAAAAFGPLRGMVLSHAQSIDSAILDTTVESFDRHMVVNARASWQLIAAFARQATGWRRDRGHDQRCHDVEPAVRCVEGRPRPDRRSRPHASWVARESGPTS